MDEVENARLFGDAVAVVGPQVLDGGDEGDGQSGHFVVGQGADEAEFDELSFERGQSKGGLDNVGAIETVDAVDAEHAHLLAHERPVLIRPAEADLVRLLSHRAHQRRYL